MTYLSRLGLAGRLPGMLSAARDLALAQPGIRTARYLVESWSKVALPSPARPPGMRPSIGLVAKVAADEAFRTLMVGMSHLPAPRELAAIGEEVARAAAMITEKGWATHPEAYHRTPPGLSSVLAKKERSWGLDYDHIRFVSGYEPHEDEPGRERWLSYKPTRTAHAWVLRHRGKPRPWLICVHGYRMGFPIADFTAFRAEWLHNELGLNLVVPVLPLHGERKVGKRSGDGFFSASFMDTVHAEAQAIWDLRRILDWVRGQDGGDRVGVYGVSLGGYTAALLAGFDPELTCVVAGMPAICLTSLLHLHAPKRLLKLAEVAGMSWDKVAYATRVISPLAIKPVVPRDRRYLFAGAADRLIPGEQIQKLWRHWEQPVLRWFEGSHLSFTWETSAINALLERILREAGLLGAASPPAVDQERAA